VGAQGCGKKGSSRLPSRGAGHRTVNRPAGPGTGATSSTTSAVKAGSAVGPGGTH
jgi:hypothetical protein